MSEALSFSESEARFLEHYLPSEKNASELPFATLTFATSLDSSIALAPGVRTQLSGPRSKAMTHYLRSRHDAILIGVGTAIADDPGLNCRTYEVEKLDKQSLEGQPRPIVLDPSARWAFSEQSRILISAREGRGRAPFILTTNPSPPTEASKLLEKYGGKYISLPPSASTTEHGQLKLEWKLILERLLQEGLHSVMIEGGASIINSILEPQNLGLISSVVITIAPQWLGQGGVVVSPKRRIHESGKVIPASLLRNVQWHSLGEDVVLCSSSIL
ncbi:hypothetical protein OPT61_g3859 [Boeremia exigua]|uniref:Uncharacterized protein n=1 Tax=Boeremia exigua TaxID=749465 RepID=A0ACC2IG98_9PLEO|nr:hypothetical protein OPT61_g3859 [Boeremia exigua]